MIDNLFRMEESLSPRLQWMQKHKIHSLKGNDEDGEPWGAWVGEEGMPLQGKWLTFAATEDEALAKLAKTIGVKFWNE